MPNLALERRVHAVLRDTRGKTYLVLTPRRKIGIAQVDAALMYVLSPVALAVILWLVVFARG